jgi:Protein of unknown function (DUF2950)
VNGVLTSGVAFLAYPAVYHTSGVMTFIINQDGRAFQKDLGPETATVATAMSEYNPTRPGHLPSKTILRLRIFRNCYDSAHPPTSSVPKGRICHH